MLKITGHLKPQKDSGKFFFETDGISTMFSCEVNSVFVSFPPGLLELLNKKGWHFYTFIGVGGARIMCSWDTNLDQIDSLISDIKTELP